LTPSKEEISNYFRSLQDEICVSLEKADGKAKFVEDKWTREGGGGGRTRVLENGNVIEKGAVNFSEVHGKLSDKMVAALGMDTADFYATGVSLIQHPQNPMVPIVHMNVRYFELGNGKYWFGGGIDLTPHYVNKDDAKFFHTSLKNVCDQFDASYYTTFKEWADNYFFIKHRNETRGIGGIFFDKLAEDAVHTKQNRFDFVKAIGNFFSLMYTALMKKNQDLPYGDNEKQWQLLRRGRYVEFNLVYDLGTKFGLETDGRIESILLSLPKTAGWEYNVVPKEGSKEFETIELLKKGVDWVGLE